MYACDQVQFTWLTKYVCFTSCYSVCVPVFHYGIEKWGLLPGSQPSMQQHCGYANLLQ